MIYLIRTSSVTVSGKTPLLIAARGNYVTIVDMIIKAERFGDIIKNSNLADDEQDAKEILKKVSFKPDSSPETQFIRSLLYKLSTKVSVVILLSRFMNFYSIYVEMNGNFWPSFGNSLKFKSERLKNNGLAKNHIKSMPIECFLFGYMVLFSPNKIR